MTARIRPPLARCSPDPLQPFFGAKGRINNMKTPLPPAVRELCARYRTQRASTGAALEHHDLSSLSQRIFLSSQETLDQVATGKLLAIDGPTNGKFCFTSHSLDALRNGVVSFVANTICRELDRRGADEDQMLMATERAFERQFALARGAGEKVIQLARGDDDDDDLKKDALGIAGGAAIGTGAAYLHGRAAQGKPLLGSPGSLSEAASTTGQGADLLAGAVARGRQAIAKRGSAIWSALKAVPLE
jgi:hypothetical protein